MCECHNEDIPAGNEPLGLAPVLPQQPLVIQLDINMDKGTNGRTA